MFAPAEAGKNATAPRIASPAVAKRNRRCARRSTRPGLGEPLAGLPRAAPGRPHLAAEMRLQLGRADPGAEVVGRVEVGIHVGEEVRRAIAHARRGGEALLVAVRLRALLGKPRPELEFE